MSGYLLAPLWQNIAVLWIYCNSFKRSFKYEDNCQAWVFQSLLSAKYIKTLKKRNIWNQALAYNQDQECSTFLPFDADFLVWRENFILDQDQLGWGPTLRTRKQSTFAKLFQRNGILKSSSQSLPRVFVSHQVTLFSILLD